MKAFAIFDGGGVKGAALAGCLKAAEELGIDFLGYGGTSAGSIVALLAAVGYSGEELREIMVEELDFTHFLDDGGKSLTCLKELGNCISLGGSFMQLPRLVVQYWKHGRILKRFCQNHGLYHANNLRDFLLKKIYHKYPSLKDNNNISFDDLQKVGCKPLKIVASDIISKEAAVFAAGANRYGNSVVSAVRASTSYPFVFEPVVVDQFRLVDGGLSSNLPIFLFEDERRNKKIPVIAFDLVSRPRLVNNDNCYSLQDYCGDMLATSLEAGQS